MTEIGMTLALMNGILMVLVGLILGARRLLVGSGEATVEIEGFKSIKAPVGMKLTTVLIDAGIPIPAECGGRGSCGLCGVRVSGANEEPSPTEVALLGSHAIGTGMRLSCQVTVRGDLAVGIPEGIPSGKPLETRVRSTRNLTPLIKEIVLELPGDAAFDFRAGSFVQVSCPPYRARLGDLPVDDRFRADWGRLGVASLEASCTEATTRAYSLANHPGEAGIAHLIVRLALPPPRAPTGTPPGVVSSYLFSLQAGDPVRLTGPFGHFVARESTNEMVFIAGGAGMAPMRAHIFEQLKVLHTKRTLSFWYGARSLADLFYVSEFDQLQREHPNFRWSVALSEPSADDNWDGARGFIHEHLRDAFLANHPAPERCEYYLCGPPLMVRAVVALLEERKVPPENILYDDFGG